MRTLTCPPSVARLVGVLILGIALCLGVAPAQAATRVMPGNFTGFAFDKCQAPTQEQMDAWLESSPYWGIGIYISGINRFCNKQPLLTPEWLATQSAKKWRILPLTVGLQASCSARDRYQPRNRRISAVTTNYYAQARAQGKAEANSTVVAAASMGIAKKSTLWFDLEHFDATNTQCRESALSFLSAWTTQLHALNYRSGFYSSGSSGIRALDDARVLTPGRYVMPDQLWIADWNNDQSVSSIYAREDGWVKNRVRQYRGGHDATYGGVTLNIDSNFMDVGRGSVPRKTFKTCGVRVDFGDYRFRKPGSTGKLVQAAQCFLRARKAYHGKVNGTFDVKTTDAVLGFQASHAIPARGRMTKRTWSALMSAGSTPLLKYGSAGNSVRRLQRALNAVDAAGLAVTGVFESTTTAAVKRYQRDHKLAATGVVLDDTWALLQAGVL